LNTYYPKLAGFSAARARAIRLSQGEPTYFKLQKIIFFFFHSCEKELLTHENFKVIEIKQVDILNRRGAVMACRITKHIAVLLLTWFFYRSKSSSKPKNSVLFSHKAPRCFILPISSK
jgi:hypothetical protein